MWHTADRSGHETRSAAMAIQVQTTSLRTQEIRAKQQTRLVRGQFRPNEADADKTASPRLVMRGAPRAQRPKHHSYEHSAAAANNQRKKNRKHSSTSIRLV